MVNRNLEKFLQAEEKGKRNYLQDAHDSKKGSTYSSKFNNNNDTDISPGADGRDI